jgi:hypothetical protein
MGKVIQNKSIKDCYVSKSMVIIKEALMYQKIPNLKYSPCVTNTIYVSPFFHTWKIGVFISKFGT